MFKNDSEIDCYHDLIFAEYMNLEGNAFVFEDKNSRLNNAQVLNICSKNGVNQNDLQRDGLLIEYPDGTFRTMHIDLVYRAINAKAASWSPKIPLEFKLVKPKEEMIPSFREHKLEELDAFLNLDKKSKDILIGALRDSGYGGLAHHQLHYLNEILTRQHRKMAG